MPVIYQGSAKLTQIYSKVNATNWLLVYRCQNCFTYDDPSQTPANTSTSNGLFSQGWAQSQTPPTDPTNPASDFAQHDNGMGMYVIDVKSATQASYSSWATQTATGTGTIATGTATATSYSSIPVPTGTTYDYVVIGGGAAGIPMADKLSAAGKSVLLIEKGVASSARWGGSKQTSSFLDSANIFSISSRRNQQYRRLARWNQLDVVRCSRRVQQNLERWGSRCGMHRYRSNGRLCSRRRHCSKCRSMVETQPSRLGRQLSSWLAICGHGFS